MRSIFAVVALGFALIAPVHAQWLNVPKAGIPRMADGRPDLNAATPRAADGRPDLSGVWEPANFSFLQNIFAETRPEDVPFQPWAAAAYDARTVKDDPANRCLPPGLPRALNNRLKTIQAPGVVTILYEAFTQYRQIFVDGRQLPIDPNPSWFGYSIGRWDGDDFIVETMGFNDKTWLDFFGHPHTDRMHLTERYRRRDFGHLDVQVTVDDPGAYTRPFSASYPLVLMPDTDLLETICENAEQISQRLVGTDSPHPRPHHSVPVPPATLARYAGTYELAPGRNVMVTAGDDRLTMQYPGNPNPLTMFAEAPDRFFFTSRDEFVEFQVGPDLSVTRLVISGETNRAVLRRIP